MRAEALTVQLRPRPMYEAADLGVRLVQAQGAALWRCWLPVWGVVAALALATQEIAAWLPWATLWFSKTWLDRTLLFVLSRAVFGQSTTLSDVWREQRHVWWGQLVATLTLRHFSPWRSYTQAAIQLEGTRGKALRLRKRQLLAGQKGAALGMQAAFWQVEGLLAMGVPMLALWFAPHGHAGSLVEWALYGNGTETGFFMFVLNLSYALAVGVVEPFFVGSGFAMYLNRRVELEAWDIEQEFRHAFARP